MRGLPCAHQLLFGLLSLWLPPALIAPPPVPVPVAAPVTVPAVAVTLGLAAAAARRLPVSEAGTVAIPALLRPPAAAVVSIFYFYFIFIAWSAKPKP